VVHMAVSPLRIRDADEMVFIFVKGFYRKAKLELLGMPHILVSRSASLEFAEGEISITEIIVEP
jgi:hypothetical protein